MFRVLRRRKNVAQRKDRVMTEEMERASRESQEEADSTLKIAMEALDNGLIVVRKTREAAQRLANIMEELDVAPGHVWSKK